MLFGNFSILRPAGVIPRYAIAILAVVVAVYLRVLLAPLYPGNAPYHMIWAAIAFAAWRCGVGPASVASVLSMLVVSFHIPFLPPSAPRANGFTGMISFLIFAGVIVALGESARRSSATRDAAEREAHKSRLLFETFMDRSPGCTYIKDRDGRYIYVNRTMKERFHLSNILGKTDSGTFPPENASRFRANDIEVLRDLKAREFVEITDEPDGKHSWLSIKFPVIDPDGNVFLGGKSFDITDRIRAEEALLAARDELERHVRERTAQLTRANDNLRKLSARLLQVRDEEHRRFARELHDSVGQLLAALSMNIALISKASSALPSPVAKALAESVVLIEQANRETRTISHLLHPPLLDEVGLESALRWYVEGFSERSGIQVELKLAPGMDRATPDVEVALFRLVQECLTNIHRHSGSKTASISIHPEGSSLCLEVQDNGVGIPADKQAAMESEGEIGVGLRGMRERLRLLGGKLEIKSDTTGTQVLANIPASRNPMTDSRGN